MVHGTTSFVVSHILCSRASRTPTLRNEFLSTDSQSQLGMKGKERLYTGPAIDTAAGAKSSMRELKRPYSQTETQK